MGCTNSHLFMFEAGGATWDLPANKTTRAELIEDKGARKINYLYDFGDSWHHKIKIGKISDPVPGELYPLPTDITGRCPPEDLAAHPVTKSSWGQ